MQYAPFAQLPAPAGLVGTRSDQIVLPAALSDLKATSEEETQKIFKLARDVVSDHDKWLSTLKEEEANRKERQELLRVVAQTSGPVEKEATLNFQMPGGSQASDKFDVEATTAFDLNSKAYQLLSNTRDPWKITVTGPTAGSATSISVEVSEAMYGQSLASLGVVPGCSYAVKIVQ
ncbi:unnamed protein product [Symbiodinium natans]|uniref:Uncharacterized protein n=1 Tax=Symbiodinium natans TaxID=878477 RepID=A0A812M6C2_9DINO|nr:unnamed protein product [Symbiodinium natans]